MKQFFGFLRENLKFVYSLILLVLIPLALIVNNLLVIRNSSQNLDTELKNKTVLAESVFKVSIKDQLDDATAIQEKIDSTIIASSQIKEITVYTPSQDGFLAIASSNTAAKDVIFKSQDFAEAWANEKQATFLVSDQSIDPPQRYWTIVDPVGDSAFAKKALLSFKVSLSDIDALTSKNQSLSFGILIASILIVLLLLINHFRFFEYAVLFKKLQEVDSMKDDFVSIASHELKTPMAAIKGYIAMIFEGVAGKVDSRAKAHLEKVDESVRRLDLLVNQLLEVSRLQQNRIQFDMQPVDISEIIKTDISAFAPNLKKKQLALKYQELGSPKPIIFADPERISQILFNLISNAIKYTPKGQIQIFHEIEGNKLKTTVKDTGIGIAPEDQKRIFERFYRVQNEQTLDVPGTGLGLWITKEMTERMNGKIYFTSEPNVGSAFTFEFSIIDQKI